MDESLSGAVIRGPGSSSALRPTVARDVPGPYGRLPLSVVVDGRSDAATAGQVAGLAGRLQLAGVWWRQPPPTGTAAEDLATLLGLLSDQAAPAIAGLIADAHRTGRGLLSTLPADRAGQASPVRLAICGSALQVERWLRQLADAPQVAGTALSLPLTADAAVPAAACTSMPGPGAAAVYVPITPDRDLDAAVAGAAEVAAGRPVLVEVAVSVGRTTAEASARADGEELFAVIGHPRRQGLFGTLEECQADAARLAQSGASELVCYLPRSHDLPDVLAQLPAISVGAGILRPGEPPSSAPPPPPGWGGRRPCSN